MGRTQVKLRLTFGFALVDALMWAMYMMFARGNKRSLRRPGRSQPMSCREYGFRLEIDVQIIALNPILKFCLATPYIGLWH